MYKSFKYRINPTKKQSELIDKHIDASRLVYNLALETKMYAYSSFGLSLSGFDLIKQIKDLKKDCVWLNDVANSSLQSSIRNLHNAFVLFFKNKTRFPKFKKKSEKKTYNLPCMVFVRENKLFVCKFRDGIKIVLHRPIKGTIKQATITKTATGKYFVSLLCKINEEPIKKAEITENKTIGIDLGIKSFAVTSDGKEYENPKFLRKSLTKLKYLQRKYSKHKGKRTRKKLAILHEKVANQRRDFLQKLSTELINSHDSLAIENLKVSNMLKNHKLALSISDTGWAMFTSMLEYKAEWCGKNLLKIGTFEPSSKTCSVCGNVNKELTLKEREWTCVCGSILNRDINASINIKNFALKNNLSVGRRLKNQKELPALAGALTSENQTD